MKIEQISPDKVKITLSEDDLVTMDIDPTCFLSDTAALNGFIIKLMREIHRKTDFDPYHGNITMEAQPEIEGMTILLSKVDFRPPMFECGKGQIRGIIGIPRTDISDVNKSTKRRKIKSIKAVKASLKPMQAFGFSEFEDVCSALVRLSDETAKKSELYRVPEGYSLLISTASEYLDDIAMVMEFADEVKRGIVFEHVREHGELVASGEKLITMIEGIKALNT